MLECYGGGLEPKLDVTCLDLVKPLFVLSSRVDFFGPYGSHPSLYCFMLLAITCRGGHVYYQGRCSISCLGEVIL